MTAINFPTNPQAGDTFLNYAYDGEKWKTTGGSTTAVVLRDLFNFSVAADDSTQRTISTGESIKFIGSGTVTTASDSEGNITITGAATNLTGYATESYVTSQGYLTSVGTISYNDLSNLPTLFSGSYADLTGTPDLSVYQLTANAFSGSYNDLTNRPTLFSGAYADLTGLPTLFDGAYSSLSGLPTLLTSYNDLTDKPTLFSGSYNDLTDTPAIPTNLTDLGISDGTIGQVLTTDGAGGFSFQAAAGGSSVFSNQYSLTATTTNATETELLVGGSTRIPVATNKSVNYIVQIAARRTDTPGDYAFFELRGVVANENDTVSDIGTIFEIIVVRTNPGYLVDARADNINNTINVFVTGVSDQTINWKAVVQTIEI